MNLKNTMLLELKKEKKSGHKFVCPAEWDTNFDSSQMHKLIGCTEIRTGYSLLP